MSNLIKILHQTPRILGILAILFISMFALDAFQHGLSLWQQMIAFLMHLIPYFILLIVLIITWKREMLGGIIFLILGLGLSHIVLIHNYNMNHSVWMSVGIIMLITVPFAVTGGLFITSYFYKKTASGKEAAFAKYLIILLQKIRLMNSTIRCKVLPRFI